MNNIFIAKMDDWETLYINGVKHSEGHHVPDLLRIIQDHQPYRIVKHWVEDDPVFARYFERDEDGSIWDAYLDDELPADVLAHIETLY